jgi:predicted Ser/Thr protein kinase
MIIKAGMLNGRFNVLFDFESSKPKSITQNFTRIIKILLLSRNKKLEIPLIIHKNNGAT